MASISVPCPKIASLVAVASANGGVFGSNSQQKQMRVWFPRTSSLSFSFGSSTFPGFKWLERKQSAVMKVQAQQNDVMTETSSNSAAVLETKSKVPILEGKDNSVESNITQASAIPAFLAQVSNLVKLVDSRDIVELELKQLDCELIIRKKEALQQSAPASPVITMQPTYPHATLSTLAPAAPAAASATAKPPPPVPTPALPSPTKTSSSPHPQLKCPMAGIFYRSPAPGEPPFVKVGDKVQKGQVVCIIEAMKLMNEIEADQSGTITEILVDDGKPVSVDTPLFVIAP